MAFIDSIKRRIFGAEKKSQTYSLAQLSDYFNRALDGGAASITNGYRYVWVYIAANKIARNIARCPLSFYSGDKKLETHAAIDLFANISQSMDAYQLIEATQLSKQLRGESFWRIIKDGAKVYEIELLDSRYVQEIVDYSTGTLLGWRYSRGGVNAEMLPEEVVQFKYINPDSVFRGIAPIVAAMDSIDIDVAGNRVEQKVLNAANFRIIESDAAIAPDKFTRMAYDVKRIIGDTQTLILEGGAKYKGANLSPAEISNIERKKMTIDEILGAYEVPKAVVGLTDGFNYANMKEASRGFWTQKLIPEMASMLSPINKFLNRQYKGITAKFDMSDIHELQESINEKIDAAVKLIDKGIPLSDVNDKLGLGFDLSKCAWTKTWWVPFSLQPVNMEPALPPEPAPVDPPAEAAKTFARKIADLDAMIDKAMATDAGNAHKCACGCKDAPVAPAPVDAAAQATMKARQFKIWRNVWDKATPIEDTYAGKVKRFFWELRTEVLKNFDNTFKAYVETKSGEFFNFVLWYQKLIKASLPYLQQAVKVGGNTVYEDLTIAGTFDVENYKAVEWLNKALVHLKEPLGTVRDSIRATLQDGVAAGKTTAEIAADIKHTFNVAGGRAKVIAQTEINSAVNGGRNLAYKALGVKSNRWVNSFDDRVRDDHNFDEEVPVDEEFQCGLKYPGDKSGSNSTPGNVINCRCITEAVFDENTGDNTNENQP